MAGLAMRAGAVAGGVAVSVAADDPPDKKGDKGSQDAADKKCAHDHSSLSSCVEGETGLQPAWYLFFRKRK